MALPLHGLRAMDTLYTLYTEDTRHAMTPLIREFFDGATISTATGLWRGTVENTLKIEILATDSRQDREKIAALATKIAHANSQTEILVTEVPVAVRHFGRQHAQPLAEPIMGTAVVEFNETA